MDTEILTDFESSLIESAAYEHSTQRLIIEFKNGAWYYYLGVPASKWQDLKEAESKGIYFNQHIKNQYSYGAFQPRI